MGVAIDMKLKTSVSAPRWAGAHFYEVDRAALIALFAAGAVAGGLLVLWAIRIRKAKR